MRALVTPIARRLFLPAAAVVVGAALLDDPTSFGAVDDGRCARFVGVSLGNDPTQEVELLLCRDGENVNGVKHSTGDAGRTSYRVVGAMIDDETVRLVVDGVVIDEPAEGWISCSDDVISLRWDDAADRLVGDYVSVACDDRAPMELTKRHAPSTRVGGCRGVH